MHRDQVTASCRVGDQIELHPVGGPDFYYGRRLYADVRALRIINVDPSVHRDRLRLSIRWEPH